MAEKHIFAYFHSPDEAEAIATKLKTLRAENIQIDRIQQDWYGSDMGFLPGAMLGFGAFAPGVDPASGGVPYAPAAFYTDELLQGQGGGPDGRDTVLTAAIDEQAYPQAAHLIKSSGGYLIE